MKTRIVGWQRNGRARDAGGTWRPIFALLRPQLILDKLLPQIIGKLRRSRLMSEANKLQPY